MLFAQGCIAAQEAALAPALDPARALGAKGRALKAEAEKSYETEKAACQNQAIAFGCMSAAKQRRIDTRRAAEALLRQGRQAERHARRAAAEAQAASREAAAPVREAGQRVDIERFRERQAQRAAERERSLAEEVSRLGDRHGKLAAERAKRQQRLAQRQDAKLAKYDPRRSSSRAERERRHVERVQKIDQRRRQYAELLKTREAAAAASRASESAGVFAR